MMLPLVIAHHGNLAAHTRNFLHMYSPVTWGCVCNLLCSGSLCHSDPGRFLFRLFLNPSINLRYEPENEIRLFFVCYFPSERPFKSWSGFPSING
jgi:hypothetical protein